MASFLPPTSIFSLLPPFAVFHANEVLEHRSQVETVLNATFVGVYDGHGGPEAARFISNHLFFSSHQYERILQVKLILRCISRVFCELIMRSGRSFLVFFELLLMKRKNLGLKVEY